jgi:hypothetical protein
MKAWIYADTLVVLASPETARIIVPGKDSKRNYHIGHAVVDN